MSDLWIPGFRGQTSTPRSLLRPGLFTVFPVHDSGIPGRFQVDSRGGMGLEVEHHADR